MRDLFGAQLKVLLKTFPA